MNFYVGNRVRIKKDSMYYGMNRRYNPADVSGTVIDTTTGINYIGGLDPYSINVKWDTQETNKYRPIDLDLEKAMIIEEDGGYDDDL